MPYANIVLALSNILVGVLVIGISIPLLKGKIKMNRWYGVRFRKSFESTENWHKINRYGAQRLIVWSAVLIAIGILTFFIPVDPKGLFLTLINAPLILLVPVIETWLYTRKL